MDWLTQTYSVPTWAFIVVGAFGVASVLVFNIIVRWINPDNEKKQSTLGSPPEENAGDEGDEEQVWTVLVKFRDGSEARWRNVTEWEQMPYGSGLELMTNKGTVVIPYENVLWILDENAAPERLESKQLNG